MKVINPLISLAVILRRLGMKRLPYWLIARVVAKHWPGSKVTIEQFDVLPDTGNHSTIKVIKLDDKSKT